MPATRIVEAVDLFELSHEEIDLGDQFQAQTATSASRLVGQDLRQSISALIVLKKVSTAELKLLYSSSRDFSCFGHTEMAVDFTDDVALQAPNYLAFALSVLRTLLDIGERWFVAPHPDDGHAIECCVGLSIAATIQTETAGFATGCRDGTNAAELCKGRL